MTLTAFALGNNIVAASSPGAAIAVMERCEPAGRWALDDVRELQEDELHVRVDGSSFETVAEALYRITAAAPPGGQLIRWDYPAH